MQGHIFSAASIPQAVFPTSVPGRPALRCQLTRGLWAGPATRTGPVAGGRTAPAGPQAQYPGFLPPLHASCLSLQSRGLTSCHTEQIPVGWKAAPSQLPASEPPSPALPPLPSSGECSIAQPPAQGGVSAWLRTSERGSEWSHLRPSPRWLLARHQVALETGCVNVHSLEASVKPPQF